LTVSTKEALAEAWLVSETVTVKEEVARGAVGVPEIAPLEEEKERPAGRAGETLKERVPTPPAPVTGMTEGAATPWVKVIEGTTRVAVTSAPTDRKNRPEALAPLASVTVTV
jgi:hypothetical protein